MTKPQANTQILYEIVTGRIKTKKKPIPTRKISKGLTDEQWKGYMDLIKPNSKQ